MNDQVQQMWKAGKNVYHLGFGESRFPTHPLLEEELNCHAQKRSYLPSAGILPLREKIAAYYQNQYHFSVSPDQVFIGIGSKSLLYAALKVLKGNVLLPIPSWVSYTSQAQLTGHTIVKLPLDKEKNYALTPDRLETCLEQQAPAAKEGSILILTSPNNPTGTVMTQKEIEAVAAIARKYRMIVLSDEIYSRINHTGLAHHSIAQDYPEGTLVFGGLSKYLSLGGWRLGVVILPPGDLGRTLTNHFQAIAGSIWSCVPAPFQYTAIRAYNNESAIETYINTCAHIHKIRTYYFYNRIKKLGIDCPPPQGAFYLYPDFSPFREALDRINVHTSIDLAQYLLQKYELATLPGTVFHEDPKQLTLRLSTSYLDMETDEKAAAILPAFQSQPDEKLFIEQHHPRLQGALNQLTVFIQDLKEMKSHA
jgi:aspartate/methionine/tyrosine aminotransferase